MTGEPSSFTCPRCGRTSWNPNDVREGYCGACHSWTGGDDLWWLGGYLMVRPLPDDEVPGAWLAVEPLTFGRGRVRVVAEWSAGVEFY